MASNPQTPLDHREADPLQTLTAKKQGGSLRVFIPAQSCRDVLDVELSEMSNDKSVEFLLSSSKLIDQRLVLDMKGVRTDS